MGEELKKMDSLMNERDKLTKDIDELIEHNVSFFEKSADIMMRNLNEDELKRVCDITEPIQERGIVGPSRHANIFHQMESDYILFNRLSVDDIKKMIMISKITHDNELTIEEKRERLYKIDKILTQF